MQILKFIFLTVVLGLSVSCLKQSESIDPLAPVKTLAELQRETMMATALEAAGNTGPSDAATVDVQKSPEEAGLFYLNMKYKIKELDVLDSAGLQNGFESLSHTFIRMLANIFLKLTGGRTVRLGTVSIPLPDLNLDFSIIKSIRINAVHLELSKVMQDRADFSFLKSLTIKKTNGENLLSYKKDLNHCEYECLDFVVQNSNVLDLVKETDQLKIVPTLAISKIPEEDQLILDGEISLQIGLKLPF